MTNQRRGRPPKRKQTVRAFGGARLKTQLPEELEQKFRDQGQHLAWLLENQLYEAKRSGYQHVTDGELEGHEVGETELHENNTDLGSNVSMRGNSPTGTDREQRLYLMKIDQKLFDEQQLIREEKAQAAEEAIQRGSLGGGVDHGYVHSNHGIL